MRARALRLLLQRAEAHSAATAARPPQQLAAALAPVQLQEQVAELLVERLEDVLRQPSSPGPAGSLAMQQPGRLSQLLAACTAAVEVSTRAAAASRSAGRPVPACWAPESALADKLLLALQQCGSLLAEACKRLEGFHPLEERYLRLLVEALHEYRSAGGPPELANGLLQCAGGRAGGRADSLHLFASTHACPRCAALSLPPARPICSHRRCMSSVQDLFLHAATLIPEVVATQAAVATRGLATGAATAAEWLDDDLDVGGRVPAGARAGSVAPTAGVSTSASLAGACKTRCAVLLAQLGQLRPADGAEAARHWLHDAHNEGQVGCSARQQAGEGLGCGARLRLLRLPGDSSPRRLPTPLLRRCCLRMPTWRWLMPWCSAASGQCPSPLPRPRSTACWHARSWARKGRAS